MSDSESEEMSISPRSVRSRSRSPVVKKKILESNSPEPINSKVPEKPSKEDQDSESSDDMFIKTPEAIQEKVQIRVGGETEDTKGYYIPQVGELLVDVNKSTRYKIVSVKGKGVFSCVVEVQNMETSEHHAIKVLRNNDIMLKSGEKEIRIIKKLNNSDPNDRRHIIRCQDSFFYQNHLCIKFEALGMNLRELLTRYSSGNGLSLEAVKSFARQGFIALYHLRNEKIIHTDIKPDNILISNDLRKIKLSDFGTALESGENKITENLVARFYRPPEIYLGYPYDYSLDVWSFGCTLFELFTGKILFPGVSDSHMLKLMMDLKGPIPKKLRSQGKFANKYFDQFSFIYVKDELEGPCRVPLSELKKEKNLGVILEPNLQKLLPERSEDLEAYTKELLKFQNLLEQCLELDSNERITSELALKHPFLMKKS
ncbi:hypothetical protein SteCoe_33144 [Stentor coeruleus]|uniref:Protein kinase domain-containing protein n=1 Tax=Stentor coeruleus TaxID=5963 RepID=A0A1R2AXF8_9CILI|nr:hypothetical protein SteCoe_33144 [Stentor coeruleus]